MCANFTESGYYVCVLMLLVVVTNSRYPIAFLNVEVTVENLRNLNPEFLINKWHVEIILKLLGCIKADAGLWCQRSGADLWPGALTYVTVCPCLCCYADFSYLQCKNIPHHAIHTWNYWNGAKKIAAAYAWWTLNGKTDAVCVETLSSTCSNTALRHRMFWIVLQ